MFISDTAVAVAIDDVERGLWFLCHCFMRRQPSRRDNLLLFCDPNN